ncbi:hypothetical protein K2173_022773 [Erythroxylum novogranatense]|uniref:Uncharacterized protein n=1 Tax=Erythroxylum novogranatense TaxID=1862640 RepID=A0AAV8SML1_9ROSI|nr:hypothetical protein K2173_022773 [Erythroxylum novogranatense]
MVRTPCCDKLNVRKGPWTVEEDAKILAYVSKHGTGNWTAVPKKAGLRRCGKSCRLRWTNYLRPDLKHDSFTPEEEELIIKLHAAVGSRWSIIAQQLPGRTDNDVKNYWNTKLRKKLTDMGIDPVTHKPFSQILADYGNISCFPISGNRIGLLNRDVKNAIASNPDRVPNINDRLMTSTRPPKMEPIQECFLSKNFYNEPDKNYAFDLLDQLQAIKLVTEASSCSKFESFSQPFLQEGSLSSTSSSCSSTCSTAAQEKAPLNFSWHDFLLEDAFFQAEQQGQDIPEEFLSRNTLNLEQDCYQNLCPQVQVPCGNSQKNNGPEAKGANPSATSNSLQVPSTMASHASFVESILDRETEMFLDFPDLLEEPFYP